MIGCSGGTAEGPRYEPDPEGGIPTVIGDTVETASGLKYIDIETGTDTVDASMPGDRLTVHYTGWLTDDTKFDSSKDRDQPFEFVLGQGRVIEGWDEGMAGLRPGAKRLLIIPPELGYGSHARPSIPANSTLVFEVDMLDIEPAPKIPEYDEADLETTSSGLQYLILEEGDQSAEAAKSGDHAVVHYTGWLTDGTMFDNSRGRSQPFKVALGAGQVIKGWEEGLVGMKPGEKRLLVIPPELGYGPQARASIPANSTLIFEVDLIETKEPPKIPDYKQSDIKTTSSGLKYVILEEGDGPSPEKGDTVQVHYTGWLEDGTMFDSSHDRGEPIEFQIGGGRIIRGWDEGVKMMKVGGHRMLIIPPKLGYGARQVGPIPANSTLFFEVELVSIK